MSVFLSGDQQEIIDLPVLYTSRDCLPDLVIKAGLGIAPDRGPFIHYWHAFLYKLVSEKRAKPGQD
jgi:hypothetical protein